LRSGQQEAAVERVGQLLADAEPRDEAFKLVGYLKAQGLEVATLAARLRQMYAEAGREPAMARAIVDVLPAKQSRQLLEEHINHRPQDVQLYKRLLRYYLPKQSDSSKQPTIDPQQLSTAVDLAAGLMHARPKLARDYVVPVIQRVQQHDLVAQLIESLSDAANAEQHRSARLVIKGLAQEAAGQTDQALATLKKARQVDQPLTLARIERARLLLNEQRLKAADRELQPLENLSDPQAIALRVTVLQRRGKAQAALSYLERLIDRKETPPVDLLIQKANLLAEQDQTKQAIQFLEQLLNSRPKAEPVYAALLRLINTEGAPQNRAEIHQRLLRRMMREIPQSRIARKQRAQFLVFRNQFDQAAELLNRVLANNPKDWDTLGQLLLLYRESDQPKAALKLLEQKLSAHPNEQQLLLLARQFYQSVGDNQRFQQVTEAFLNEQPPGPQRDAGLGLVYLNTERYVEAIEAAERALEAKPKNPVLAARVLWRACVAQDQTQQAVQRLQALRG
jgi:tetratricopeptide (TPR) repeat protein